MDDPRCPNCRGLGKYRLLVFREWEEARYRYDACPTCKGTGTATWLAIAVSNARGGPAPIERSGLADMKCATCKDTGAVPMYDRHAGTRQCPDCTREALFAKIAALEAEAKRDAAEIEEWITKCNRELRLRQEAEIKSRR